MADGRSFVPNASSRLRAEAQSVPCPLCGAAQGDACETTGFRRAAHPHAARILDARRRRYPRCTRCLGTGLEPDAAVSASA